MRHLEKASLFRSVQITSCIDMFLCEFFFKSCGKLFCFQLFPKGYTCSFPHISVNGYNNLENNLKIVKFR